MPYDNKDEVGAIWQAVIKSGPRAGEEYLDVKLEVTKLLDLVGQQEVVRISAFAVNSENPKAPMYRLKVRIADGAATTTSPAAASPRRPARPAPRVDDSDPF